MACVYSDHCMRLLSRKFFSEDACVVIGHILALDGRFGLKNRFRGVPRQEMWVQRTSARAGIGCIRASRAHCQIRPTKTVQSGVEADVSRIFNQKGTIPHVY